MRARNIKPGFCRNEALGSCSRDARLLAILLWMIADREGRLEDRPKRIKAELMPYDDDIGAADVDAMLGELEAAGHIQRYTVDGAAYIAVRNFTKYQTPYHREQASCLPPPPEKSDIVAVVCDDDVKPKKGKRFDALAMAVLPDDWRAEAARIRPTLNADDVFARFADYWLGKSGKDGVKSDWLATWRNWLRNTKPDNGVTAKIKPQGHLPLINKQIID